MGNVAWIAFLTMGATFVIVGMQNAVAPALRWLPGREEGDADDPFRTVATELDLVQRAPFGTERGL